MINSSLDIKTIGEILRTKRKEKDLELKQVAEITRIRVEYLKALETGDYKAFSSEVYIKGFLKNYAKFLGISTEKALAMYRRENKQIKKQAKIEAAKIKKSRFDFTLTPEKLIIVIISIITLSVVYYIATQVSKVTEKPAISITSPVEVATDSTGLFETEDPTIGIKGKISTGATLKLNGDKITTNNLQKFELTDLELSFGQNEFVFVAESQFGRESKTTLIINRLEFLEQDETEEIEPETTEPEEITGMELTVEVVQDVANIHVITDGTTQINQVLQPNSTREFTANESIIIQTPRPAYIKVTINGKEYSIETIAEHEWKLINGEVQKTH